MSQKELIIAVDQSLTSTGIAFRCPITSQIFTHCIRTSPDTSDPDDKVRRAMEIREHIHCIVEQTYMAYRAEPFFAIEDLAYGATVGNSNRDLAGLFYLINAQMLDDEIPIKRCSIGSVKKHTTGKGNAGKPQMAEGIKDYNPALYEQIVTKYNKKSSEDVVDAVSILLYTESEMGLDITDASEDVYRKAGPDHICLDPAADEYYIAEYVESLSK